MTSCASSLGFRIYFSHHTLSSGNPTSLSVEAFFLVQLAGKASSFPTSIDKDANFSAQCCILHTTKQPLKLASQHSWLRLWLIANPGSTAGACVAGLFTCALFDWGRKGPLPAFCPGSEKSHHISGKDPLEVLLTTIKEKGEPMPEESTTWAKQRHYARSPERQDPKLCLKMLNTTHTLKAALAFS